MKPAEVRAGSFYLARLSRTRKVCVRVLRPGAQGAWMCLNTETNREVCVPSADKLLRPWVPDLPASVLRDRKKIAAGDFD